MKALNIIETGYRATLEEQDDTVVWITHAMVGAGAELDVLLRGNAVCYALKAQDASGLRFGDERQTQAPQLARDVAMLLERGGRVYVEQEALEVLGIRQDELIDDLQLLDRREMARLLADYDRVWQW